MLFLARFKIVGHSMEPQIKEGEQVLVSKLPYLFKSPQINDIVAFKDNKGMIFIKRINHTRKNKYFVQGDNLADSLDSRNFGEVPGEQIIGKIIFKL